MSALAPTAMLPGRKSVPSRPETSDSVAILLTHLTRINSQDELQRGPTEEVGESLPYVHSSNDSEGKGNTAPWLNCP